MLEMSYTDVRTGVRKFVLVAAVLVAVAVLPMGAAACSSDEDGSSDTEETTASSADSTSTTGEPVTELMPPKDKTDESGNEDGESGSSGSDSSGSGSSDSSGSSDDGNRTVVVGGKTADEYDEQIPELEAQLEGDPENPDLLLELAVAQFNTQRYTAAAETYEKLLEIEDDPMMRNNYANVLREWGKTDQAIAEYRRALEDDPTLSVAYINLASVLNRNGESEEALQVVDEGLAQVPEEDKSRLESLKDKLLEE